MDVDENVIDYDDSVNQKEINKLKSKNKITNKKINMLEIK